MNTQLEISIVKKFVVKEKQQRYIVFLSSEKNRKEFIDQLSHFRDFKWDLFEEVKGIKKNAILNRIKEASLKEMTCYVISEDEGLDQKNMTLETAFAKIGGWGPASILVFGNGEFIYYEGEPPFNQLISKVVKEN